MLEASQYEDNVFATLTYRDGDLPVDLSVCPAELSSFVKRLRANSGVKFRYFGVGEYGDESGRPHYHLALFGYPMCRYGITRKKERCCAACDTVSRSWGKGQILLGTLEVKSARYIAGYTVKKMTADDDPRLEGRLPEFARMSLRPGIGIGMMHELASVLLEHKLEEKMIDVPMTLQHGMKQMPLGRFLRRKLRTFIGREANAPEGAMALQKETLQNLRKVAWENKTPLSEEVQKSLLGKQIQSEARERRNRKRSIV